MLEKLLIESENKVEHLTIAMEESEREIIQSNLLLQESVKMREKLIVSEGNLQELLQSKSAVSTEELESLSCEHRDSTLSLELTIDILNQEITELKDGLEFEKKRWRFDGTYDCEKYNYKTESLCEEDEEENEEEEREEIEVSFGDIFNRAEDVDNYNILNSIKSKGEKSKFGESQFESGYTFEFGNPLLSPKSVTKRKGVLPKLVDRNRYTILIEIGVYICVYTMCTTIALVCVMVIRIQYIVILQCVILCISCFVFYFFHCKF